MSTKTTSFDRHRIDEMAIALYRAAHDAAVDLPRSYAVRVAATMAKGDGELGVSRLGSGVVIHTVPQRRTASPHRWLCRWPGPVVPGRQQARRDPRRGGASRSHGDSAVRPSPIEAARARHSLDDVARRAGINLYRTSGSVMVRCPLPSHGHFDRSPSLQLHLDDGIWHCFGCGQTGDVVEWVCQSEGVGWRQAIRILDSGSRAHPRLGITKRALPSGPFLRPDDLRQLGAPLRDTRPDRLSGPVPNTGGTRLRRSGRCLGVLQLRPAP